MQIINVGTNPNDGTGDNLRNAFIKVQNNFNELVVIDSSFSGDIQTLNTIISDGSTLNHTHTISQIIGLQTSLSGKVSTSTFNTQILAINASIQAINISLSSIINILNTKINDAPYSGITYGRKDGSWVEVSGGTGGGTGVPYTGATSDVNLGEFGLLTGNLEFDNTPTNIPITPGSMYWNNTDGTLDLILKGSNVTLQIGQESMIRVVNKTATNITLLESNYQAVRITGAQGQRLKVDLALATNDLLSAETIGLVTETIANNQEGFITTNGLVRDINTTGSLQGETWLDGDILYLSPTIAGELTKIKPMAPNHLVVIGYVVHAHITQGTIFVKVDNGYELDELHNVKISGATNNDILTYNSSLNIWENKQNTPIEGGDLDFIMVSLFRTLYNY